MFSKKAIIITENNSILECNTGMHIKSIKSHMEVIPINFKTVVTSGKKEDEKREGFSCTYNVIFIKINKRKENFKNNKINICCILVVDP